jgi:hypothetical protein
MRGKWCTHRTKCTHLHNHLTTRKVNEDEGLDPTSLTRCPALLHDDILPAQLRPLAHKSDFIRLMEPRLIGHTSSRRIEIEIEVEIIYNMYRMRRSTPNTLCAGCCLWALPTMPYMELTSQG